MRAAQERRRLAAYRARRKACLARQEAEGLEIARQVRAEGGDAQAVLEGLQRAGYGATLAWAEDLAAWWPVAQEVGQ